MSSKCHSVYDYATSRGRWGHSGIKGWVCKKWDGKILFQYVNALLLMLMQYLNSIWQYYALYALSSTQQIIYEKT